MQSALLPLVFSAALLATGCSGDGSPTAPISSATNTSSRVAIGTWGGDHLRMDVTAEGANLEFDCAHGTIDEPLITDAGGNLEANGKFFREHGGPVHEGEETPSVPAHFKGTLKGETLTLSLQITTSTGPQDLGTYELKMGSPGRVFRCL